MEGHLKINSHYSRLRGQEGWHERMAWLGGSGYRAGKGAGWGGGGGAEGRIRTTDIFKKAIVAPFGVEID